MEIIAKKPYEMETLEKIYRKTWEKYWRWLRSKCIQCGISKLWIIMPDTTGIQSRHHFHLNMYPNTVLLCWNVKWDISSKTDCPFYHTYLLSMYQTEVSISIKQSRCPSADEWIRKLWYIYTMEYYSAIKKNSFESVLMRWMKLEPIIQSEVSQKEKHQYSILTHIYGI